MSVFRRLIFDTEAATAVEYAVMLGLVLAAVIAGISSVGDGNANMWQNNSDEISNAFGSSS